MKCNYCHEDIPENTNVAMYAVGEKIAIYCSPYCMTKAFQRMVRLLKNMHRKKPKAKKKGGKNAKPKIAPCDNPSRKKAARP